MSRRESRRNPRLPKITRAATADSPISQAKTLVAQDRFDEAFAIIKAAVAAAPDDAALLLGAGELLRKNGNARASVGLLEESDRLRPNQPECLAELAAAYVHTSQYRLAETTAQRLLRIDPAYTDAYLVIITVCYSEGRLEEGVALIRSILPRAPEPASLHWWMGVLQQSLQNLDEAAKHFDEALRLAPTNPVPHFLHGLLLLARGDFEAGWREYAHRFRAVGTAATRLPGARWNGEPLQDGHLLIQCEQGLGDTLQMARYIPMVVQRLSTGEGKPSAAVSLLCQRPLRRLLGRNLTQISHLHEDEVDRDRASFTRVCSLLDLPAIFHPTAGAPASFSPYITATESALSTRLTNHGLPTVGLVWSGGQAHLKDKLRSMSLELLRPVTAVDGVTFVSLQVGRAELSSLSPPPSMTMIDPTGDITDFEDTAAIVAALDLVITVDTSTAHLAGAMGRPTWVFIPSDPDWRWMFDREDSPLYPTMRLFRQQVGERWEPVVERVAQALRDWVRDRANGSAVDVARNPTVAEDVAEGSRPSDGRALPLPALPLSNRPLAKATRRPRVLVVPLDNETTTASRLGARALDRRLPVAAERRVVAVPSLSQHAPGSLAEWADLVVVGVGDSLTPALARDPALHDLLAAAPRALGIFGTRHAADIERETMSTLLARLQAWMARHAEDAALFGQNGAQVVHLGDWLLGEAPLTEATNPALLVAGDPATPDTDLDSWVRSVQRHSEVRATTPLALRTALGSARRVLWDAPDPAVDALLVDVFGQRYPHGQWLDVDRTAVAAYRQRLRILESGLEGLLKTMLDASHR